jgi:ribonuclease P protein component
MPSERFTKAHRVRRRGEFKRVFDLSLRMKGRYLTVLMAPNGAGTRRLGIVASRKLGDAVRRNRAKRLIRDIFRRKIDTASAPGYDLVVIPRRELLDAAFASLELDFCGAVKRCAARLPHSPSHASR